MTLYQSKSGDIDTMNSKTTIALSTIAIVAVVGPFA